MPHLDWLVNRRIVAMIRREADWLLTFDPQASLAIWCLWRILEHGHIRRTDNDDGQKFGLPAPVDAEQEANLLLAGSVVNEVNLHEGTLDLRLQLTNGVTLEILPNSSGYEAWQITSPNHWFLAVGGGDLAEMPPTTPPVPNVITSP
jgi:hypothetical protein